MTHRELISSTVVAPAADLDGSKAVTYRYLRSPGSSDATIW
jgi:hypothetical protein